MSASGNLSPHQFGARVLAGMDPDERALSLAQESVRFDHPKLSMRLPESHTEASETLRYRLHGAGHPRADEAYVTMHRDPSRTSSNTGRGPDGEPVVGLHRSAGTMARWRTKQRTSSATRKQAAA